MIYTNYYSLLISMLRPRQQSRARNLIADYNFLLSFRIALSYAEQV